MTEERGTVAEYIQALRYSDQMGPQIVAQRTMEATVARFPASPVSLPAPLRHMLAEDGIKRLYSHQDEALVHILAGRHTLTATATASGKSLIYNLPVFAALENDPSARALYLFPLKALAQDQLRIIHAMAARLPFLQGEKPGAVAAMYDGDTSAHRRKQIRERPPAILVSNPDMLHLSLLPHHSLWARFFANLRYVVLDEVHVYRGIFGSHMAWVLRRLRRLCALYGSDPVFILSSATIGNPEKFGQALLDGPVEVVSESGGPRAKQTIILLNPLEHPGSTATKLLQAACVRTLRSIIYTSSRKMTELITIWAKRRLGPLEERIASYRAGFLPEDRRDIEHRLHNGDLLGVISTSALELGIDIGGLDLCILFGYPGSMMATWQRAGRVGRAGRESLVVLIGQEDALDQYFMRNPEEFFERPVEQVVLNPDNQTIAAAHLVCAAAEYPLQAGEPLLAEHGIRSLTNSLTSDGRLLQAASGTLWFSPRKNPQREINLRGGGRQFVIRLVDRQALGEIDGYRVFRECHPGAVYLHGASHYQVTRLDLEAREVQVSKAPPTFFTKPLASKETLILETKDTRQYQGAVVHLGFLRVTEQISGYQKLLAHNRRVVATHPLDLPPQIMETEGLWIEIPEAIRQAMEKQMLHFMGGIHAMEHALIGMMPLHVLCDRNDLGGISQPYHEQLSTSAIFLYDGHAGGIGLCRSGFAQIGQLLQATLKGVASCGCATGCPSCVHSPRCGSGNRPIDKAACITILEMLLHPACRTIRVKKRSTARPEPRQAVTEEKVFHLPAYGVFDVETRRSAEEVGGWHRAKRMGVSVAVLYDSSLDQFLSYDEDNISRMLDHLFRLDLVVGFNNKRFDNQVLAAYGRRNLNQLPALDLLELVSGQLGYRLSLDRLAEHTLGIRKSGNGLQALRWFKEGKMEELTQYCRKDVQITRDLFLFGLRHKHLLFQNKAGKVVRLPVDFQNHIEQIQGQSKNIPAQRL